MENMNDWQASRSFDIEESSTSKKWFDRECFKFKVIPNVTSNIVKRLIFIGWSHALKWKTLDIRDLRSCHAPDCKLLLNL